MFTDAFRNTFITGESPDWHPSALQTRAQRRASRLAELARADGTHLGIGAHTSLLSRAIRADPRAIGGVGSGRMSRTTSVTGRNEPRAGHL